MCYHMQSSEEYMYYNVLNSCILDCDGMFSN